MTLAYTRDAQCETRETAISLQLASVLRHTEEDFPVQGLFSVKTRFFLQMMALCVSGMTRSKARTNAEDEKESELSRCECK